MIDVRVGESLWASAMLPEGILERWLVSNGASVGRGQAIAEVRIEDALHEIQAPQAGTLTIDLTADSVIEPGAVLGRLRS
jgi:pyruvate/2-oxoglutarate dehydrogenase complex dihydrolipoamide acyltransferase (E2) component